MESIGTLDDAINEFFADKPYLKLLQRADKFLQADEGSKTLIEKSSGNTSKLATIQVKLKVDESHTIRPQ